MLRSPLSALADFRGTTLGVVFALAAALWFIMVAMTSAVQLQSAAEGWWEQFLPVVYLEPQVGDEYRAAVREEIEGWSEVDSVRVDEPEEILSRLQDHLGEDDAAEWGVKPAMMPTGLVVRPRIWRPGQVELLARLEALEVRSRVLAVDAPKPQALAWMDGARAVIVGFGVMVVILLLSALIGLATFLYRLQEREGDENHLLEVFGASPAVLRRSTLLRGVILGTAAGALGGLAFLPWSLVLDGVVVDLVGVGALPAQRAALWAVVMVPVGSALGTAVGWVCGRPKRGGGSERSKSLLDWERKRL